MGDGRPESKIPRHPLKTGNFADREKYPVGWGKSPLLLTGLSVSFTYRFEKTRIKLVMIRMIGLGMVIFSVLFLLGLIFITYRGLFFLYQQTFRLVTGKTMVLEDDLM
jgi:hypothetical protein